MSVRGEPHRLILASAALLALASSGALAQPRRPACDPIAYPPGSCGRLPDHCGGFIDLGPCPTSEESPSVTVHDLGVFTIGGADLAAPPFATTLAGGDSDVSWLYVQSTGPLESLRVQVRYPGGRASWAYPAPAGRRGAIAWTGVGAPPPDAGAWTALASAVATPVGSGLANGVLFHGGRARVRSPIEIRASALVRAQGEHTIWIVSRGGFAEHRVFGREDVLVRTGEVPVLRRRLLEELVQRGAPDAEASALLDVRGDALLSADERAHVLYFLPRAAIDRAQPLRIEPAPEELVRVRLVEDHR